MEMPTYVKEQILETIARAQAVRETALTPGNRKAMGYPFSCGYSNSALESIAELMKLVK